MNTAGNLTFFGYEQSVCTRAVRLTRAERAVDYRFEPLDSFNTGVAATCRAIHPFGRVPAIDRADFRLCETTAGLRCLDIAFPTPALTADGAQAAARMVQVAAITDAHGYWTLVRQVFAHRVFRPYEKLNGDAREAARGLETAVPVLVAPEQIAAEGLVLTGGGPTLADCYLAPLIAAFTAAPEGAEMMRLHSALAGRWAAWGPRPSMRDTDTGFDRMATAPG